MCPATHTSITRGNPQPHLNNHYQFNNCFKVCECSGRSGAEVVVLLPVASGRVWLFYALFYLLVSISCILFLKEVVDLPRSWHFDFMLDLSSACIVTEVLSPHCNLDKVCVAELTLLFRFCNWSL